MTREDAIEVLKLVDENVSCDDCLYYAQMEDCPTDEDCIIVQAVDMAIKALSQEPCEKPTTEDAIKTIQELMIACTPDSKYYRVGQMAISAMLENEELSKDLDEALQEIDEYERGLSQEPCDDAISRQAVINAIEDECIKGGLGSCFASYDDAQKFRGEIEQLPSVTQKSETVTEFADRCRECGAKYGKMLEQKSGKWISRPHIYGVAFCSECGYELKINNTNYCPNCGARMESNNNE